MYLSDILGPIDYFSDIENLVSFERDMIEVLKWNENIPMFRANITTSRCMPQTSWTVYMWNIWALDFYQYICGQIIKIIFQIYYIFTLWSKTFDTETRLTVFVGQWKYS